MPPSHRSSGSNFPDSTIQETNIKINVIRKAKKDFKKQDAGLSFLLAVPLPEILNEQPFQQYHGNQKLKQVICQHHTIYEICHTALKSCLYFCPYPWYHQLGKRIAPDWFCGHKPLLYSQSAYPYPQVLIKT